MDKPWLNNYPSGVPATIKNTTRYSSIDAAAGGKLQKYANRPISTAWAKPHLRRRRRSVAARSRHCKAALWACSRVTAWPA